MKLDYEIDYSTRLVHILHDGERVQGRCLTFGTLNHVRKLLMKYAHYYDDRGPIYMIARDYLIEHGYLKEE